MLRRRRSTLQKQLRGEMDKNGSYMRRRDKEWFGDQISWLDSTIREKVVEANEKSSQAGKPFRDLLTGEWHHGDERPGCMFEQIMVRIRDLHAHGKLVPANCTIFE
eukprot:1928307-Alexandrium_andersonii.AAC.1